MIRALVDTNRLINGPVLRSSAGRALFEAWRSGRFELLTSPSILAEFREVLNRPYFRQFTATERIDDLVDDLRARAIVVAGIVRVDPPTADPDDAHVFAAAIEGHAEFIVTNDKRMLALGAYHGIHIVDAPQFLAILEREDTR
jgi:putative PIN family toxin of toxin-antitoxin system